jgi:hypothetical protein
MSINSSLYSTVKKNNQNLNKKNRHINHVKSYDDLLILNHNIN